LALNKENQEKKTISLIILGKFSEPVLERLQQDLIAGIAIGHFQLLCNIQQEKAKKDPQGLFIKSFAYQEYDYAYLEIIQSGAAIGVTLFQEKILREEVMRATETKNINWGEKEKKYLIRVNEEEYSGEPIIAYWEKEPISMNWIVPLEATKIWQNVQVFNTDEAEELATKHYNAKNKSKLEVEILDYINK
ncbi:MAG: hypothetical protein ACFFDW_17315, partial [Candidatus Thorarchaeota archaeon]